MATFYSNKYDGRQLILDVWQDGNYMKWKLTSTGGNSKYYTIYYMSIYINGTEAYNPGTVAWDSYQFPAATGTKEGSVYIGPSASYRDIYVSFTGTVWYDNSNQYGGYVGMSATIFKPSLSGVSISSISDTSAYASFSVTNNNGEGVSDSYIDLSETNFGSALKVLYSRSGTFSGLEPNKTYYVRGNAANSAGRSYTSVASFTTTFVDPGAPSNLKIAYDTSEPIPTSNFTLSWGAGTAGSKAIAGYRLRIYKNAVEVAMIDTDNANTSYSFNAADYDFQPGDILSFGLYSYSKDWAGTKHFNGGGMGVAQVFSGNTTVVSDKFIYVSINGGAFNKYKMFISVNGGSFNEIKKEKFKVI